MTHELSKETEIKAVLAELMGSAILWPVIFHVFKGFPAPPALRIFLAPFLSLLHVVEDVENFFL